MNSGKRGAHSELLICADLLTHGFDVYRSISQSCDADVVAVRGDLIFRIEIRTAYEKLNGDLTCPSPQPGRFDVLALVTKTGRIEYRPEII